MRWGLLVVVMLVLVAAPAAHAGIVSLTKTESCECDDSGGTQQVNYELQWSGDPGEANTATVGWSAGALHVKDTTAPVRAGDGCTVAAPGEAACRAPADCQTFADYDCVYVFNLVLDGGDGDDTLGAGLFSAVISAAGASQQEIRLQLNGGDGNDTPKRPRHSDRVERGPGAGTPPRGRRGDNPPGRHGAGAGRRGARGGSG